MKFDYDQAWRDTTALLSANFGLLAVIAGMFFFLPYAALMIALPGMAAVAQPDAAASLDVMMAAMTDFYRDYWWLMLALGIIQGIGMLAMLALLRRRASPTVGEALATGAKTDLPYIGAQILQTLAIVIIASVLVGGASLTGSTALAFLLGLVALVLVLYLFTKLSLVAPVMAIEGVLNPIAALRRSWSLTKGSSVRLFFFYLLIFIAFTIVSAILSGVLSLAFALGGEEVALFGTAIVSALINSGFVLLIVGLLAAVHTQLARMRGAQETAEGP